MKRRKYKITYFLLIVLFLIGFTILLYPSLSDAWNKHRAEQLISKYVDTVDNLQKNEYKKIWKKARTYNKRHRVNIFSEDVVDEEYSSMLNPGNDNVMGHIEIPKIDVNLPIFHGVNSKALENGCGHIEGTSLPIGGKGSHTVISAHRGLPSAKMFSDIDQLKKGDLFYIKVLDKVLAYKIDNIKTVLPKNVKSLRIKEGKDLATLVTCTPYGINSHRLLIRGHRVKYVETQDTPKIVKSRIFEGTEASPTKILIIGCVVFLLIIFLIFFLFPPM